jgi:hypothetical protein
MAGIRSRTPVGENRCARSLSCRPRGGCGGGERFLVEQVVEKMALAGLVNYPPLTKINYNDWALLMKIKLQARLLWVAVASDDVQVEHMDLDAICSVVPPEMISTLTTKPSVKEAWESIKTMRIDVDRVHKASAQKLRREYEQLTFCDGESIEDFTMQLTSLMNQLVILDDPEADDKVITKYLLVVWPRYRQLVVSMETLLDITMLSMEEVIARLKAVEDDGVVVSNRDRCHKLYLIEEEWLEHFK